MLEKKIFVGAGSGRAKHLFLSNRNSFSFSLRCMNRYNMQSSYLVEVFFFCFSVVYEQSILIENVLTRPPVSNPIM
jgi:hypothetical protein